MDRSKTNDICVYNWANVDHIKDEGIQERRSRSSLLAEVGRAHALRDDSVNVRPWMRELH